MAEEEEKLAPAAEEVEKGEDAVKDETTKNEEDTLPEPTKVEEAAMEKAQLEQLGASNTKETTHISNLKQSMDADPVVQPLLTGNKWSLKSFTILLFIILFIYSFCC